MLLPLLVLLIWPVVKGWRLRAEANPHRIKPDALRLMRALRWYLYEPPLTSVYIVIILLLDVVPSGGRGIGEFVPEHVFLMVPMLILLAPLGSLRSTDTMVRSYAAKALGPGTATHQSCAGNLSVCIPIYPLGSGVGVFNKLLYQLAQPPCRSRELSSH